MKTKIAVVGFLSALVFISCKKNDQRKDTIEQSVVETVDENKDLFKVSLDLLIEHDDTLHLYYAQSQDENYSEESSIWLPVEGKTIKQEITFNLPKEVLPIKVRIDFGVNRANENIVLDQVRFNYYDKVFIAKDSTIFNYFRPDESATILDKATRTLSRIDKTVEKGPSLYPHDLALQVEINKLVK